MEIRVVLGKVVALIYRSRVLGSTDHDDLIKTVLQSVKTEGADGGFGNNNVVKKLKELCLELVESKELQAKEVLIPRLQLTLENDAKLYASIKESVDAEYDDASNKRIVSSLIKVLHNYYKEHQAQLLINKASYDLTFNRSKIGSFTDYLRNLMSQMEPLTTLTSSLKDPALVSEVDFESEESVTKMFAEVRSMNTNEAVYKFGWQGLNRMTQGGGRLGEFISVAALPHKYKTGSTCSMFADLPTLNKPIIRPKDVGKKPLVVRISFEDNLSHNLQFIYQYLKAGEGDIINPKDLGSIDLTEMTKYVTRRMTETGFYVKMRRVDPSQWSYSHICNYILELEAQGYSIHILMLDYLLMVPTTGCIQGPMGTDKRDLFRRVRNFTSARGILCITPAQLSTEAKKLLRTGIPEHLFVNEVVGKGMYADCSQLDQEIDLEIFIHLFTHKRKKYLAFARGKHRLPTVIDSDDMYMILPFPGLNIPVLPDVGKPDSSMKTLPKSYVGEGEDFTSDLLG